MVEERMERGGKQWESESGLDCGEGKQKESRKRKRVWQEKDNGCFYQGVHLCFVLDTLFLRGRHPFCNRHLV